MSLLHFNNVRVSGICSIVPRIIRKTSEYSLFESHKASKKYSKITGVEERRIIEDDRTTLDLCCKAASRLLDELSVKRESIELVVFVTQTPDFSIPNNAIICQEKLGLPKNTICFDIPLGCSGYVYAMSVVSSFIENGQIQNALLLVGDTLSKQANPKDKSTYPLFGDAGSATLLKYSTDAKESSYKLWSDGSGFDKIIIPQGGYRNRINEESFKLTKDSQGNERRPIDTFMDGSAVFNFTISVVPEIITSFLKEIKTDVKEYEYFIMHQANKFINETLRKKLSFSDNQVLYSIERFGNTSSTTIPLTMCANKINSSSSKVLLAGFGVGLSVGIASLYLDSNFQSFLIDESKE